MLLFKNQKFSKTHSKFKKNQKKYLFLNQFQILKFLTIKFLRCNIYQIRNDNINYVPKKQIYLSKTTAAGCLFKKIQKKPKKSKNPKAQKQQPYYYTTSFPSSDSFF